MAYQIQRDPLFDANMQAAIEKRGKELIGIALLILGLAGLCIAWSYHPTDPNWLIPGDGPVQNWLGSMGAAIAAPLFLIIGHGTWVLALTLMAWALRFMLHIGPERILRAVFTPIAIAATSVYAATLQPGPDWAAVHSFGLGGLFGDMVMGVILTVLPINSLVAVKIMSLLMAVVMLATCAGVMGFSKAEIGRLAKFLLVGLILIYDTLIRMLGWGARSTVQTAQQVQARRAERKAARDLAETEEPVEEVETPTPGFLSNLVRRPQPELVEDVFEDEVEAPSQDRISEKIARVISSRGRPAQTLVADPENARPRIEPRLTADAEAAREPVTDLAHEFTEAMPIPVSEPRQVVQKPARKAKQPSRKAKEEAQPSLLFEENETAFDLPPLALLEDPVRIERHHLSNEALEENARMLESVLDDYGVKGEIVSVRPGPVVTMYELEPAPGLKASRVIGLADDIARSMAALSARVSTLPGRSVIGIELPNENREKVVLREILATADFGDSKQSLPLALGKNIGGDPVVANLARMPHLLIAGTTGSGKSVAINTMILSLLYKLTPDECRLIMIDPKMLELSVYDGIPHLLSPVVTDPKKAVVALKWVVGEMEERYRKMSKMGVRNIEGYNGRVSEALAKGEMFNRTVQTGFDDETGDPVFETEEIEPKKLPFIVVIVDEMADLMMVAGKEIEACIQRLAQMARASGIHLIMATQRPSVDVITGTIKANFPTRISFQVTSKIDSRTILGEMGAEQLLGMGDMLYMAAGGRITRCHAPFVSDEEVEDIVNHLKSFGPPEYVGGVVEGPPEERGADIDAVLGLQTGGNTDGEDALYDQAVAIVIKDRKCSTSYIQRKLAIGYNKAARLVEQMEDQGVVSSANHVGKREILVPEQA